jgi:hypothetical protein
VFVKVVKSRSALFWDITPRNIPEERKSHVHRGGSLKWRTEKFLRKTTEKTYVVKNEDDSVTGNFGNKYNQGSVYSSKYQQMYVENHVKCVVFVWF